MKAEWTNNDSLTTSQTTKAILVLDMPNECDGCPCLNQKLWECQADKKRRSSDERPSWCPLRPLPNKKPVSYYDDLFGEVEKNFNNIGWNACIDAIIGDTDGTKGEITGETE